MKLSAVQFKDDARIKELAFVHVTDDVCELSFEAGLVTITRRSDGATWDVPVGNMRWIKRAEPKAAKKAA
jgi:hypothetical protein